MFDTIRHKSHEATLSVAFVASHCCSSDRNRTSLIRLREFLLKTIAPTYYCIGILWKREIGLLLDFWVSFKCYERYSKPMLLYSMWCYCMLSNSMLCYNMLCYSIILLCYSTWPFDMLQYVMLQYVVLHYVILQYVTVCYVTVCCVTVYYVTKCSVTVCCSM